MSAPVQITFDEVPDEAKGGVRMCQEAGYGVRIIRHEQYENGPSYEFYVDYDAPAGHITIEEGAHARHA
jgi:hypothetical protein